MQCRNIDAATKGMSRKKIRKSKKQKTSNKVKIECLLTYTLDYRNNCISKVGRKRTESEIKNEELPPTIKGRGSTLIKIIPLKFIEQGFLAIYSYKPCQKFQIFMEPNLRHPALKSKQTE